MRNDHKVRWAILAVLMVVGAFSLFNTPIRQIYLRYRYGSAPGVGVIGQDGRNFSLGRRLPEEIRTVVEQLARLEDRSPQNAKLVKRTGEIIAEQPGVAIDITATVDRVMAAEQGATVVPLRVAIQPDLTETMIRSLTQTIGSYRTYMYGNPDRAYNIQLATSICNYVLLMPGDVFSFNQVVGPRTLELGYRDAPVIEGGELVPGAGGGVCQVSSTLYNAVLSAKLKVIERYRHSRPVRYVPEGRDATVAYDYLDLKFMNNRSTPIIVRGWADSSRVGFSIMGAKE